MMRRLLSVTAILSLLLCLGTLALCVRTCHSEVTYRLIVGHLGGRSRMLVALGSEHGSFTLIWITRTPPVISPRPVNASGDVPLICSGRDYDDVILSARPDHTLGALSTLGFDFLELPPSWAGALDPYVKGVLIIGWPHWFAMLLTALPATVWMFGPPHRKRNPDGACRACGYDLTGNASGICPECGTPITWQSEIGA